MSVSSPSWAYPSARSFIISASASTFRIFPSTSFMGKFSRCRNRSRARLRPRKRLGLKGEEPVREFRYDAAQPSGDQHDDRPDERVVFDPVFEAPRFGPLLHEEEASLGGNPVVPEALAPDFEIDETVIDTPFQKDPVFRVLGVRRPSCGHQVCRFLRNAVLLELEKETGDFGIGRADVHACGS